MLMEMALAKPKAASFRIPSFDINILAVFMSLEIRWIMDKYETGQDMLAHVDALIIVDKEEPLAHLLHHLLDLTQTGLHIDVAEQACQIVLAEIEHEIELGLVPAVLPADLYQVDDVLVVEEG